MISIIDPIVAGFVCSTCLKSTQSSKRYSAPDRDIAAARLGQSVRKSAAICLHALARADRRTHYPKDQGGTPFTDELTRVWEDFIEKPAREAGFKPPELVILHSPYRLVTAPIFRYVLEMERMHRDRPISVLVPELVEWRWYYYFLHNQRATALRVLLYAKGTGRINCHQRSVVYAVVIQAVLPNQRRRGSSGHVLFVYFELIEFGFRASLWRKNATDPEPQHHRTI